MAKSILDITEEQNSDYLKRISVLRQNIHKNAPISIFKVTRFLVSKESTLSIVKNNQRIEFHKSHGDDYKLREYLGLFIEEINTMIVTSMSKYNTDRGRGKTQTDFDFENI
jgi:hypothetical protein